jgi:hypothetical protein
MTTIWYDNIMNVLLQITDPNTWGATSEVPGVSTLKINGWTSIYNVQWWWDWIAGWDTDIRRTSSTTNVSWSSGNINLPDWTQYSVSSGSVTVNSATYIYLYQGDGLIYYTTTARDAVWEDKILLCVAFKVESWKKIAFQAFGCGDQSSVITASQIAADTITANEIDSNTINSNELIGNTITGKTIRTSSSGERFVMSSSTVAQYDSNWTKRVQYMWNWITFYDSNWIQSAHIIWDSGAVYIDLALEVSEEISSYNISWTHVNGDEMIVSDSFICNWDAEFNGKLKIPVWVDLY